jgi:hypothetical protein
MQYQYELAPWAAAVPPEMKLALEDSAQERPPAACQHPKLVRFRGRKSDQEKLKRHDRFVMFLDTI